MQYLFDTAAPIMEQIKSINGAVAKFHLSVDEFRARVLAYQYRFSHHYLIGAGDPVELATALVQAQIPGAGADDNACLPVMRLLSGRFDPAAPKVSFNGHDDLTKFRRNEGWSRYAGVHRWLFQSQTHPDEAEAKILAFPGGLTAILAEDRKKNGKTRAKPSEAFVKVAIEDVKTRPAHEVEGAAQETGLRMVWAYVENGVVHLGGVVSNSEQAAKAAAAKYGATKPQSIGVSRAIMAEAEKQAASMAALRASVTGGEEA
ncbi:hypothetical protein [Caulobacter sp. FWC2]|uniref:hypothetical protein n=1 Tax=Caulobacter sp. FWC2 TaxID=69664 RepID=UPI000C15C1CA|nr:hypothetical protein [Caulobacter sp. FWC2]PIB90979.1 hypothetical protein CSW62_04985 [Caulobacter sp. FWC2]